MHGIFCFSISPISKSLTLGKVSAYSQVIEKVGAESPRTNHGPRGFIPQFDRVFYACRLVDAQRFMELKMNQRWL